MAHAAGDATVYVFGEDRSGWRMASPRTHKSDPARTASSVSAVWRPAATTRSPWLAKDFVQRESGGSVFRFATRRRRRSSSETTSGARWSCGPGAGRSERLADYRLRPALFPAFAGTAARPAGATRPGPGGSRVDLRPRPGGDGRPNQGAVLVLVTAPLMESHSSGRNLESEPIEGRSVMTDASGGFSLPASRPVPIA